MDRRSITLRAANPTLDDGLAFARYADQASEGFLGFMLGRRAAHILATAFLEPDHEVSYQNVTFAERDNVVVGMVSAYTGERRLDFSDLPLERAAGRGNLRMRVVRFLFAPLMRITESIPESDYYVHAVAVDPELRGGGVGSLLMDAAEQQGRESGSKRIALDVSAKNEGAHRFYERRGMTVEARFPKRLRLPALKFYRMTKDL